MTRMNKAKVFREESILPQIAVCYLSLLSR